MFKAILIVCLIFAPECLVLEDQRGPYETLEECEARHKEMAEAVMGTGAPLRSLDGLCATPKEEDT